MGFFKKSILILFLAMFLSVNAFTENIEGVNALLKNIESMLIDENVKYSASIKIVRNKREIEYDLTIWMKNRDFVSKVEKPIVDKGTVFLNVNNNSWIYYPSIEKTIKSSNKQRILGSDFSFTDISSVNLLEDYDCKLVKLSSHEISEVKGFNPNMVEEFLENGSIIEGIAKANKIVNYPKVRVYINSSDQLIREEFYTISGKLLGILSYEDYEDLGGKIKPKKLVMRTTLSMENYTILTYKKAAYEMNVPNYYFSESYMNKLSRI